MEMKKFFSESDLPMNLQPAIENRRLELLLKKNKLIIDSQKKIISSPITGEEFENDFQSSSRGDDTAEDIVEDLVEVRKKLKKVSEDCTSVSETNIESCSNETSETDIRTRDGTNSSAKRSDDHINNNLQNKSSPENESKEKKSQKKTLQNEQTKSTDEVADKVEKKLPDFVLTDEVQMIETVLSSLLCWIEFGVLIFWVLTLIMWYSLPLFGVEESFFQKLMLTDDSEKFSEGIVRKNLVKMKQYLYGERR